MIKEIKFITKFYEGNKEITEYTTIFNSYSDALHEKKLCEKYSSRITKSEIIAVPFDSYNWEEEVQEDAYIIVEKSTYSGATLDCYYKIYNDLEEAKAKARQLDEQKYRNTTFEVINLKD